MQRDFSIRHKIGPTRSLQRFVNSGERWGMSNTVELESTGRDAIMCMDFDSQGILLSTGDTKGNICVFDFDEVFAADMRNKNDICRIQSALVSNEPERKQSLRRADCDKSEIPLLPLINSVTRDSTHLSHGQSTKKSLIRPIISFKAKPSTLPNGSTQVTCVKWNPHNEDELAASFLNQGDVFIYDVTSLSSSRASPRFVRLTDKKLQHSRSRGEGITSLLFLPSDGLLSRVMASNTCGTVRLWTLPRFSESEDTRQMQQRVKLKWETSPFSSRRGDTGNSLETEGVSDMVHLSRGDIHVDSELILIGGNKGSVVLLNIKKCTRKAFSTSLTPTVVQCWNIPQIIQDQRLISGKIPPRNWMGIKKICVWDKTMKNSITPDNTTMAQTLKAVLVSNCGWVFELNIDDTGRGVRMSIIHKTTRVNYINSDYMKIQETSDSFSLPPFATPAVEIKGSSSLLCLTDVKPQHLVLADKKIFQNRQILSNTSLPTIIHSGENDDIVENVGEAIIFVDTSSESKMKNDCVVSKICVGSVPPRSLIMHPSSGWIILGCEGTQNIKVLQRKSKIIL